MLVVSHRFAARLAVVGEVLLGDVLSRIEVVRVVLGIVLIAGGYLGLLDAIASRVIQAIL